MAPQQDSFSQDARWSTEAFYRVALDEAAIVAVTDPQGRIEYANDRFCEISGYSRHELLGQDHRLLNSGYHERAFFLDMYAVLRSGRTWRGEIRNRAKDGSIYWVDTTIVPMIDDSGRTTHFVAIRQDITRRKEMELELANAKKKAEDLAAAKDHFLASVSHDIRTPMTAILGYVELLKDASEPPESRQEALQIIERNGQHLLTLINDILDLAKISSCEMKVTPEPTCPITIIEQVYSLFKDKAAASSIAFDCSFETEMPREVSVDVVRMTQVLNNLVSNAIKFTQAGGVEVIGAVSRSVDLAWHTGPVPEALGAGLVLRIEVRDSGIGMTEAQLKDAFSAFHQADGSISRRFGGTGLGLSIVSKLVDAMGGILTAQSEPGVGSTFTIQLPVGLPEEQLDLVEPGLVWDSLRRRRLEVEHPFKPKCDTLAQVKILLADDAMDSLRLYERLLTRAGARVTCTSDGQQALDSFREGCFDLVLLDVNMPVLDGPQVARLIREFDARVPVLALTASAAESDRVTCEGAGFTDYLVKPVSSVDLIDVCQRRLCESGVLGAGSRRRAG